MPADTFLAKITGPGDSQRTKRPATRSKGHKTRSATAAKSKSKQRFANDRLQWLGSTSGGAAQYSGNGATAVSMVSLFEAISACCSVN